ncbi:MAG: hypothetical protein WAM60_04130, partial [Candidatus Promineifilaceae bacterium]
GRSLTLPDIVPTPIPTLTPTPLPTATAGPTSTPQPTPTIAFPTEVPSNNDTLQGSGNDNSSLGVALSFLPAMLLVGVAFFFGLRAVRGGQR